MFRKLWACGMALAVTVTLSVTPAPVRADPVCFCGCVPAGLCWWCCVHECNSCCIYDGEMGENCTGSSGPVHWCEPE